MIAYIGFVIVVATPLVLGVLALLRGRPEDYPEILRSLLWRRKGHLPA
jgi:hypothetical protein